MNSEKWKVILCSAINLSIVPFLLSTGLRKLVCARSLVKSFVKSTDLYAGLIRLAICHVWHWCPLASGQHPLFSLPISPASPFQHPLIPPNSTLKCLSCTELCSRPSPHSYPSSRFQQLPISSYSQILSTAHPSSIHACAHTHTHTHIHRGLLRTFFGHSKLNSPFSSTDLWLLQFCCQATMGPV